MTDMADTAAPPGQAQSIAAAEIRMEIRRYILEDILLGSGEALDDIASLSATGIIDSLGALELVAFLEAEFNIRIGDKDLVPANLDSVNGIVALVERKLAAQ